MPIVITDPIEYGMPGYRVVTVTVYVVEGCEWVTFVESSSQHLALEEAQAILTALEALKRKCPLGN